MTSVKKGIPVLWNDILHGVKQKSTSILITPDPDDPTYHGSSRRRRGQSKKQYLMVTETAAVYFTAREVDTMKSLMFGGTLQDVAGLMGLSRRTVEFYVKNLRQKLKCTDKNTLVEKVEEQKLLEKLEEV